MGKQILKINGVEVECETNLTFTFEIPYLSVLESIKSKSLRAYGYYLGMSKKNGRNKNYVKVINKIFL